MPLIEELMPDAYYAFLEARRRWSSWRAKIVDADDALAHVGQRVKLRGIVEPVERPLAAQFSGSAAVFYEVVLKERQVLTGGKDRWKEMFRSASTSPFHLVGKGGTKVLIEPTIAIHTLRAETLPAAEHGRRTEARLAPAAQALVFGLVSETTKVAQSGYRTEAMRMARLIGTIAEPLVIAQAP